MQERSVVRGQSTAGLRGALKEAGADGAATEGTQAWLLAQVDAKAVRLIDGLQRVAAGEHKEGQTDGQIVGHLMQTARQALLDAGIRP